MIKKKGIFKRSYNGRVLAFYIDGSIFTFIPFLHLFFNEQHKAIEGLPKIDSEKMFALQLIIYFVYFSLAEYFFGNTVGKKLLGYKVVHHQNTKPNFGYFLLRTLIRLNPIDKLLYLIKGELSFWHERWSGIHTTKRD